MDIMGQTIKEWKNGAVFFTARDLTYAHGQIPPNADTIEYCNFSLLTSQSMELIGLKQDSMV